jgi:uncharacterized protein involved in exopolysaccharide biosynthesis
MMIWTPRVYSSTTTIEVPNAFDHSSGSDSYFWVTQLKVIKSYSILTNVIAVLHLDEKLAAQTGDPRWTVDQTYRALLHGMSVEQMHMTNEIAITVENRDPKLAAEIANAIVDAYRDVRGKKLQSYYLSRINNLREQLSKNETNIASMETKLNELRIHLHEGSDFGDDGWREATYLEKEYQHLEMGALADYLEYSNILAELPRAPMYEHVQVLGPNPHQFDPEVSALFKRLNEAKEKAASLKNSLGTNHPSYQAAEEELARAQIDYDCKVTNVIAFVKQRVEIDRLNIQIIRQKKKELETNRNELVRKNRPDFILKRDIEELRRNNEELNRTIQRLCAGLSIPWAAIVRYPARASLHPTYSKPEIFFRWMLRGTLLALVVGGVGSCLVLQPSKIVKGAGPEK